MGEKYRDVLSELELLQRENEILRNRCIKLEKENQLLKEITDNSLLSIKQKLLGMRSDKGFSVFEQFFLEKNLLSEIEKGEKIAKDFQQRIGYYEEFRKLYIFRNEIYNTQFKILLLLQIIGDENTIEMQTKILENHPGFEGDFLNIVFDYHESVRLLGSKLKNKKDFRGGFSLYTCKEEMPKNEKEQRKLDIRDNTIINFYHKYGEKMFQEKNMRILKENLDKVGIDIYSLTEIKIRQIIGARKFYKKLKV